MAENSLLNRVSKAFRGDGGSVEKAAAIPSHTLGSNMTTTSDLSGYGETEMIWTERERNLNLVGQRRWDVYHVMVRDTAIIAAGVRLLLNLLANAVWTVNPPEDLNDADTATAQEYADQAYDILFDMTTSWSTVVKKTAGFRFLGFAILEWTAMKRPDGVIGFLDVEHRPQRTITRWKRDASGTVESVFQRVMGRPEVELPRSKVVYAVDDTLTDHPEGMGLFRHLAETQDRLQTFLKLEEIGFETDLRGIPIARAPLGELQKEVKEAGPDGSAERAKAEARRVSMLQPLRDFIEKHIRNKKTGVLLPSDTFLTQTNDATTVTNVPKWVLELLTGDSTSFADMAKAVERMNYELARILGVEHLMLGSGGTGSLALAKSKVGTFYLTVTSTLLDLVEVFDRDLIGPLATLNGWPPELTPQMGVNEISDRDIEQVTNALMHMAQAGAPMMPGDPAVGELYDMMGLTRQPDDTAAAMADASLNPQRNQPDPQNPDGPVSGLEEQPALMKRNVLRSRRNMAKIAKRRAF